MKTQNHYSIYILAVFCLLAAIEFSYTDTSLQRDTSPQYISAGINGKHVKSAEKLIKKGVSFFKSCKGSNRNISENVILAAKWFGRSFSEIKTQEEILPKIEEYLSTTKPDRNKVKVINCLKSEANEIKMSLYEPGSPLAVQTKTLKVGSEVINLSEYNLEAFRENTYIKDGVEYVEFILPKKPQYVLHGKYEGRLYECMVFNIPKDIEGRWERIKEYIIAFINDIINRPDKLWNEYRFRQGLARIDVDCRDVQEIERYLFAHTQEIKLPNGYFPTIQKTIV